MFQILRKAVKDEIDIRKTVIIDCPPGTSCPVIHSVYGSHYCILVTEPTPFGLHDLKLMVGVLKKLEIPYNRQIAELYSTGIPFVVRLEEWQLKFLEMFEKICGA